MNITNSVNMQVINLVTIRSILAIIVFIGAIPLEMIAHTEQEYVQWCFDRKDAQERVNDRTRLKKELRLWRIYNNAALELTLAWQQCIMDAQYHTNPH